MPVKDVAKTIKHIVCLECGCPIDNSLCSYECRYDAILLDDRPANAVGIAEYSLMTISDIKGSTIFIPTSK